MQDVMAVRLANAEAPRQAGPGEVLVGQEDAGLAIAMAATVLDRIAQGVEVSYPQVVQGLAYLAVAYDHVTPLPRATEEASTGIDASIRQAVENLRRAYGVAHAGE